MWFKASDTFPRIPFLLSLGMPRYLSLYFFSSQEKKRIKPKNIFYIFSSSIFITSWYSQIGREKKRSVGEEAKKLKINEGLHFSTFQPVAAEWREGGLDVKNMKTSIVDLLLEKITKSFAVAFCTWENEWKLIFTAETWSFERGLKWKGKSAKIISMRFLRFFHLF